jgi:tetratricopeptide (TPR) repeat protein
VLPPGNVRWIRIDGKSFTVVSDGSENVARQIGESLEQVHRTLAALADASLSTRVRTFVFALHDEASFRRYSPDPNRNDIAGAFVQGPYRNYMLIKADRRGEHRAIAYHEYLHSVGRENYRRAPLWYHEGVAEYFSTFRVSGREAQVGIPRADHLLWLRSHPLMPLSELLTVDHESPHYNESERAGTFYAQSWALAHYLFSSKAPAEGMAKFLDLTAAGGDPQESLSEALAAPLREIENDLRRHTRSRAFYYESIPVVPHFDTPRVEILSTQDALVLLGDLVAYVHDDPAIASAHFEEALLLEPGLAKGQTGRGLLCYRRGDLDCAISHFRRSLAAAPGDAITAFLLGSVLVDQLSLLDTRSELGPEQSLMVGEARHSLQRAVELDSELVPALVSLAWTYTFEGPPAAGLELLDRAQARAPGDALVPLARAVLLARKGESDEAWRVLAAVTRDLAHDPSQTAGQYVARTRLTVAREQLRAAQRALDAGRAEEALSEARRLQEHLHPSERALFRDRLRALSAAARERAGTEAPTSSP